MFFDFCPESVSPFDAAEIFLLHESIVLEVAEERFLYRRVLMPCAEIEDHAARACACAGMKHVGRKREYCVERVILKHHLLEALDFR